MASARKRMEAATGAAEDAAMEAGEVCCEGAGVGAGGSVERRRAVDSRTPYCYVVSRAPGQRGAF